PRTSMITTIRHRVRPICRRARRRLRRLTPITIRAPIRTTPPIPTGRRAGAIGIGPIGARAPGRVAAVSTAGAVAGSQAQDITRRELSKMLSNVKIATDGRKGRAKKVGKPRRLTHRPNRVFELTRAIFRWGVAHGIVEADPTLGVKRPIKK